jgi:uracil-DNA glycosylase
MLNNISSDWLDILNSNELNKIKENVLSLTEKDKICPPVEKWFNWARLLKSPQDIKVILIGMDPYPRLQDAHGLSFSSLKTIPPSLKNIFKCLEKYNMLLPEFNSKNITLNGNLSNWCKQGILLLNVALSTEIKVSGKHLKIWLPYMSKVIKKISDYGENEGIQYIFLLWGNQAQSLKKYIDCDFHEVMEWIHPSPMAQANAKEESKFINCTHFLLVNDFLKKNNQDMIIWDPRYNPDKSGSELNLSESNLKEESNLIDTICKNINYNYGSKYSLLTHMVFSDGSCINNGKKNAKGGYAAIFIIGPWKNKKIMSSLPKTNYTHSNIRAEGESIIQILELLKKDMLSDSSHEWRTCQIYTDSDFWRKMILDYMPKWSESQFLQKKNPDMTLKLWNLWNWIMGKGKNLELIWVPAHNKLGWKNSNDLYKKWCYDNNDVVDKLATYAREYL